MNDVKRYRPDTYFDAPTMMEEVDGGYVEYEDYKAVVSRLSSGLVCDRCGKQTPSDHMHSDHCYGCAWKEFTAEALQAQTKWHEENKALSSRLEHALTEIDDHDAEIEAAAKAQGETEKAWRADRERLKAAENRLGSAISLLLEYVTEDDLRYRGIVVETGRKNSDVAG